jgi:hypothetical protein
MNNDCKLPGTPPPLREHHFDYEKMAAVITMAWGGFAIIFGTAVLILTGRRL